jgi:membrane fusion protein (multidrug efflux system)
LRAPLSIALLVFSTIAAAGDNETGLEARGVISPRSEAVIASDLVAKVETIPFKGGDRFEKGDALVKFDCRRYRAELKAARADERASLLQVNENKELHRHKAVGINQLEISRAKHAQSVASADALEVRISQCTIAAPFPGRIVEKLVNEHETPRANEPLLKIIDDQNLEIEIIVPSDWLRWLRVGQKFKFQIDETRRAYSARITTIGAAVDPISQTIRITGDFQFKPVEVLSGMSGTARFDSPATLQSIQKG